MNLNRKFPFTRLRRTRSKAGLRSLVAETNLTVDDLIQPIFIKENLTGEEEIESMPEIKRYGLDLLNKEIEEIVSLGIKAVAVFPVIDEEKKDPAGLEAINENNFLTQAIRQIKESFPDLIIFAYSKGASFGFSKSRCGCHRSFGHDGWKNWGY